jgi:hypothetical protein
MPVILVRLVLRFGAHNDAAGTVNARLMRTAQKERRSGAPAGLALLTRQRGGLIGRALPGR